MNTTTKRRLNYIAPEVKEFVPDAELISMNGSGQLARRAQNLDGLSLGKKLEYFQRGGDSYTDEFSGTTSPYSGITYTTHTFFDDEY